MKITSKILSIPPYISTAWDCVVSLFVKQEGNSPILVVILEEGSQIEIPSLSQTDIDTIFAAHAQFSESSFDAPKNAISFGVPFKMDGGILDSWAPAAMQHDPSQSDLPLLPSDMLTKITSIMKALGVSELPNPENGVQDCHCIHCQLAKALQPETEEEVSSADLRFRDWEITQKDTHLYHVVNPLDTAEYYDVFLGNPLGCTCGNKNCEHIRAVLKEPCE